MRAREIIAASGADTQEFFERVVLSKTSITFKEQSEVWFAHMSNPRREGKKTGLPTAVSTLTTWRGILDKINTDLGHLPLSAIVEDQTPVAEFVAKMVNDGRKPKTIRNYIQIVKMVVASAKDKKSRKQLYPVAWDQDVLLVPAVREQNTPCPTGEQVTQIVAQAEGQYRVLFAVLPAAGLRIGEGLGLQIPNVLDNCTRLRIVEKNYNGKQEDRLKTFSGKRTVELHSSIAAMLREHIGDRTTGYVFQNKKGKPLCQTNIIKRYLHPILMGNAETPGVTGVKAGNHAFRRFRNSYLRTKSCPVGLLKYWMGHSRKSDMSDVYDKSWEDSRWRAEMAGQLGIGFTLPVMGRIVPSCTEIQTAAGAAAVCK